MMELIVCIDTGFCIRCIIKNYLKENPSCLKAGILTAAAIVCTAGLYAADNSESVKTNEKGEIILKREQGEKDISFFIFLTSIPFIQLIFIFLHFIPAKDKFNNVPFIRNMPSICTKFFSIISIIQP